MYGLLYQGLEVCPRICSLAGGAPILMNLASIFDSMLLVLHVVAHGELSPPVYSFSFCFLSTSRPYVTTLRHQAHIYVTYFHAKFLPYLPIFAELKSEASNRGAQVAVSLYVRIY